MPNVLFDVRNRVAILTFNRPEKLNALNYALIDELMGLLDIIEADPEIQVIILTGNGRAFSAGGDIPEFAASVRSGVDVAVRDFVRRGQAMTARLESFAKPIIAAVNGIAVGGGCEITEAVHIAIASDRALFAKPEINLGMPPTFGGTQRLPRQVGRKRALELLLTGDPFSPERAHDMGLINKVVPHDELLASAREMACRIMRHSPLAAAGILRAVTRGINVSIGEGLAIESEQFARMAPTPDLAEGLGAWIARRTPIYNGSWTKETQT
jgi:enoyl-CoA hydratase